MATQDQGPSAAVVQFPNSCTTASPPSRRGRLPKGVVSLKQERLSRESTKSNDPRIRANELWQKSIEVFELVAQRAITKAFEELREEMRVRHDA